MPKRIPKTWLPSRYHFFQCTCSYLARGNAIWWHTSFFTLDQDGAWWTYVVLWFSASSSILLHSSVWSYDRLISTSSDPWPWAGVEASSGSSMMSHWTPTSMVDVLILTLTSNEICKNNKISYAYCNKYYKNDYDSALCMVFTYPDCTLPVKLWLLYMFRCCFGNGGGHPFNR